MAGKSNGGWKQPPNSLVWVIFCVLIAYFVVVITGARLPFQYTAFAFYARFYALFPLLLAVLFYFGWIYHKPGQKTGYQQRMRAMRTS